MHHRTYVPSFFGQTVTILDARTGALVAIVRVGAGAYSVACDAVHGLAFVVSQSRNTVTALTTRGQIRWRVSIGAVGKVPNVITVDRLRGRVFISANHDNQVYVLDEMSGRALALISAAPKPAEILSDAGAGRVYVASDGSNTLTVLNAALLPQHARTTITVGQHPSAVVIDQARHRAFVANTDDGTVTTLDVRTDVVLATTPVVDQPTMIVGDALVGRVFVASGTSAGVSSLNATTGSPMARIPIGDQNAACPYVLAVDPSVGHVFVAPLTSDYVVMIDATSGQVMTSTVVGFEPTSVAVDGQRHRAYVGAAMANTLSILDTHTNALVGTVRLGPERSRITTSAGPLAVAVDATLNRVFVASSDAGTISIVDPGTERVLSVVRTGPHPVDVAVDERRSRVYVADDGNSTVTTLDARRGRILNQVAVDAGPVRLAVDAPRDLVYVAAQQAGVVTVLDANAGAARASVTVGDGPDDLAVGVGPRDILLNPDAQRVYVSNEATDNVFVLNAALGMAQPRQWITAGVQPTYLALDTQNHHLFVSNEGDNTVQMIDASSGTVLASTPIDRQPSFLALDATAGHVFVTSAASTTIQMLDAASGRVLSGVKVGSGIVSAGRGRAHASRVRWRDRITAGGRA